MVDTLGYSRTALRCVKRSPFSRSHLCLPLKDASSATHIALVALRRISLVRCGWSWERSPTFGDGMVDCRDRVEIKIHFHPCTAAWSALVSVAGLIIVGFIF